MADLQDNIAYGHVESNEIAVECHIYELPEILPPESKKDSSWSPKVVNNKKGKRGHCFNIFITVLALFSLLLALTTLITFLVHYSSNQPLETQQSIDIEALKSLLNKSNEEILIQISKLEKAQLLIQTLQEQLNISNQEKVIALQEAVHNLEQRLNNTDYGIQELSVSGLRKVANIDMTDFTQQCPDGFKQINRTEPPLRTCGRPDGNRECVSATFPVNGIEYSHVCGRIIAYQVGSPSGFSPRLLSGNIDSDYVAGISLTHGQPRQHIWTFANARGEGFTSQVCPCVSGNTYIVPEFVGSDYFCDSAIRGTNVTDGVFYPNDPLWDGQGCGNRSTCCEFNNPPWFCKQLPRPTTDDIEMRLCENSRSSADDSPFELVELFVD